MANICDKCSHKIVCKYKGTCDECNQFAEDINVPSKWISVKDRLPETGQPCLCYKNVHGHPDYMLGKYLGAMFSDNCAAFRSMTHFGCIGVTHWMPLPEPPKGE